MAAGASRLGVESSPPAGASRLAAELSPTASQPAVESSLSLVVPVVPVASRPAWSRPGSAEPAGSGAPVDLPGPVPCEYPHRREAAELTPEAVRWHSPECRQASRDPEHWRRRGSARAQEFPHPMRERPPARKPAGSPFDRCGSGELEPGRPARVPKRSLPPAAGRRPNPAVAPRKRWKTRVGSSHRRRQARRRWSIQGGCGGDPSRPEGSTIVAVGCGGEAGRRGWRRQQEDYQPIPSRPGGRRHQPARSRRSHLLTGRRPRSLATG